MEIVTAGIEHYLAELSRVRDPVLDEMESEAEKTGFPIVGPQVGRLLFQLARVSGAKRILELGSGYGYSAYWFARALQNSGELILTEFKSENLTRAADYLRRAGFSNGIDIRAGDALAILKAVRGPFDIIFNDVDKAGYPEVFKRAIPLLRPGGLLITDNTLWYGKVLEPPSDADTAGVVEYNRLAFETPGVFSSLLPIRDGVALTVRL